MVIYCLKIEQEEDMLVNCIECGQKAIITKRKTQSEAVADLYCSCKDSECGHTFVMTLAFSHTLSPSAKDTDKMLIELLRGRSQQEQLQLLDKARA